MQPKTSSNILTKAGPYQGQNKSYSLKNDNSIKKMFHGASGSWGSANDLGSSDSKSQFKEICRCRNIGNTLPRSSFEIFVTETPEA